MEAGPPHMLCRQGLQTTLCRFPVWRRYDLPPTSAGTTILLLAQVRPTAEMRLRFCVLGFCGASYKRAI